MSTLISKGASLGSAAPPLPPRGKEGLHLNTRARRDAAARTQDDGRDGARERGKEEESLLA